MQAKVIYKHALDNDERMSVFKRAFSHDSNNRNHSLSDEHGAEKSAKPISHCYLTLCYDMIRDAISTCNQKLTRVSLIYRTEPTTIMLKT